MEIENYAAPKDIPALLWLLDNYSRASQFRFVACCGFVKRSPAFMDCYPVWAPTKEGRLLYKHREELANG